VFLSWVAMIFHVVAFDEGLVAGTLSPSFIDELPAGPSDYEMRDWKAVTLGVNSIITDFEATGEYSPVVWWDNNRINYEIDVPFIPSFVGIPQGGDALNLFPAIVGATLVGIDMSDVDGHDWVRAMKQFQGHSVGRKVIGNNKNRQRSTGLWYDVMPGVYFSQAVDLYPELARVKTPYSGRIPPADGVVSFTGAYFQDFDGLHSTTRTTELLPATGFPYHLQDSPFNAASGMTGWYIRNVTAPALNYRVYGLSGTGSGFVNFGIGEDRALGGISNGSTARPRFGVVFRNDTQDVVTAVDLSFAGEQWRGTENPDHLTFTYRVSISPSIDGGGEIFDDDEMGPEPSFVEPGANFDFTGSPELSGIIDGSSAGRVEGFGGALTDLHWLPGEFLVLRWTNQAAGAGLAIDDLSMSLVESPDKPDLLIREDDGASMEEVMYQTAAKWWEVLDFLGGSENGFADFTGVVGFNTVTMEIDDRDGTHPGVLESAAGLAWIHYMAYRKFGDERFLTGAQWAMNYLEQVERNPMHNGMQMGYGALAMARMNAELGFNYDVDQMFRWIFGEGNPLRDGWGVLSGSYGEFEVSGLIGTEGARGGGDRAYAKQGFNLVGSLVPMVRYDSRYARAVGKWVLHLASSSRHYYQTFLNAENLDSPFWSGDPDGVIPFESLRGYHPKSYFEEYLGFLDQNPDSNPAVREQVVAAINNPPALWASGRSGAVNGGIGLCTYFAGDVGYLGAIVETTNREQILQLNLLATDFFRDDAYPTFLYYNPWNTDESVRIDTGPGRISVYDTVAREFILENVSGVVDVMIPATRARVLVHVPADGLHTFAGRKFQVDGIMVDYYREGEYDSLSGFWKWAKDLPYGHQGPSQDPFDEGFPNLLRFAFGHPALPGFALPALMNAGPEGAFFRADVRTGLILWPEISSDLQSWMHPDVVEGAALHFFSHEGGFDRLEVFPPPAWARTFFRFGIRY
jgi:hypothetical protein